MLAMSVGVPFCGGKRRAHARSDMAGLSDRTGGPTNKTSRRKPSRESAPFVNSAVLALEGSAAHLNHDKNSRSNLCPPGR